MVNAQRIPKGYKKTEVGVIPEDWRVKPLGDLVEFLDSQRRPIKSSDRAQMAGIYPYYGATGILDYVNDYLFDEELILLGEDGENILSRNLPLAFKVSGKIWVNNHAHVLRPKDGADIDFLVSYLDSLDYTEYNSGTAQPKITKQTCASIPIPLPPLPEQRAIAAALSDVDGLLAALDALIAKKRAVKTAAMQQLLTGKTRLPGFTGKWVTRRLGDLLVYERPDKYIVKDTDYRPQGQIPVLTANKSFILGYTDERFGICENIPVIVFDDFTTDSKYVDFPFKVKSSAIKLLRPRDSNQADLRFIYELMQIIHFPIGDHKRYYIAEYQHIQLPVPAIEEQRAIAAVLSDMDAEIAALEARREKVRQIKQGMMQVLLTGKVRLVSL